MTDPLKIETQGLHPITKDHMVFFGCSYTSGTGLTNINQHYATHMANSLEKISLNYAYRGLNNYAIFDLFSQCDFVDCDIPVVVQLTQLSRVQVYDTKLQGILMSNQPTPGLLEVYNDKFLIYDMIRQLRMLVKYARLCKIKLVIWSIARTNNSELDDIIETYLAKYPEYIFMDNRLGVDGSYRVDNGTDGSSVLGDGHPGPKSNVIIAEQLLTHYNKLYK
jgi:hypothetical protein